VLIEAFTQTVFGNVYFLGGNDDINVGAGVTITSLGSSDSHANEFDAITTYQGQHTFTVSGTINGFDEGINTIGCTAAQTVEILATGVINSGYNSTVVDADGVILDGVSSTLINRGLINAQGSGVMINALRHTENIGGVDVTFAGTTVVTNYGTITADKYGIWIQYGTAATSFINFGTVESGLGSFRGGEGIDIVTNRGIMRGDVTLGNGDDTYSSTNGRVIGTIFGGNGDDTFVVGNKIERIDGGDGRDTLDFTFVKEALTVDLSNNANNVGRRVASDTYTGIEVILGTSLNDVFVGDGLDNVLVGNRGADILSGGIGNDTLVGGVGLDTLTGGLGSDVFVFNARNTIGDVITDFDVTVDRISLEGSAFGYGDYAGGVSVDDFVISNRAFALDATDRFVFRTTDASLWFDADGVGGLSPIRIADLQDGAHLSSYQLLIV